MTTKIIQSGEVYRVAGKGPVMAIGSPNVNGIVEMLTPVSYRYSAHVDNIHEISDEDLESFGRQHKCLFPLDTATDYWVGEQLKRRKHRQA